MEPVVEIAAGKLRPNRYEDFAALRGRMAAFLAASDGFVAWRHLRAIDEADLVVDVIEWQSADSARAAGEAFLASELGRQTGALFESFPLFKLCTVAHAAAAPGLRAGAK